MHDPEFGTRILLSKNGGETLGTAFAHRAWSWAYTTVPSILAECCIILLLLLLYFVIATFLVRKPKPAGNPHFLVEIVYKVPIPQEKY